MPRRQPPAQGSDCTSSSAPFHARLLNPSKYPCSGGRQDSKPLLQQHETLAAALPGLPLGPTAGRPWLPFPPRPVGPAGHASTVWEVAFDTAGQRMVSCSDDCTLKVWACRKEAGKAGGSNVAMSLAAALAAALARTARSGPHHCRHTLLPTLRHRLPLLRVQASCGGAC